ncbi:dihydroxyacetone kinase subunit DhaL [Amycolatopsis endophytica]|uniref:Dihydroxyacetone kinase n=1 Tax=Amycolatopsis endophytica TaxID=860233 RepID=A0A853BBJ3_9PSEU|nr:DAK2 domain-containing protein [Amycolatopsis endophytica]NYI92753.1 dihydroxyacetone kinase [Amycolatopsis endophytica]
MNATAALLQQALTQLPGHADELRDLDAHLGDGDLGITVSSGADAARAAVAGLPDDATPAALIRAAGAAFGRANPSTFAALVHGAANAAAAALGDAPELGRAEAELVLTEAIASIAKRGRSARGDKTVLDALSASLDALRSAPSDPASALARMIEAARADTERLAANQSQKGRAAWIRERSVGHPDAGSIAYIRFLQALHHAVPAGAAETERRPS